MKNKFSIIFSLLFHIIFYLYILLLIKPELIYHHQQLGFSFDKYSLAEYLTYPGGIAECASLFLFQFNINSFSGALLYTILTFLIVFLAGKIIGHYKPFSPYYILKYLPGILIAGLLTNYSFLAVFIFTVLLLLLFFYAFINILNKLSSVVVQVISFIIFSGLTYYVSGGLAFLIFSLSSFIYILSKKAARSIVFTTVLVTITILIPFLASKLVFFNTIRQAYFSLIPQYHYYEPDILLYSIYFYLPFMLLVLIIAKLIRSQVENEVERAVKVKTGLLIQYMVILLAFFIIVYFKFQKEERHKISVDYYSYYKQWDKILEIVKQNPSDDRLIQFHTNRALYHTGQLNQSMFEYPQVWGVDGLFLSRYLISGVLLPTTELYIDLGHINDAIHWGNEAFSQDENSPQILELLIISNIIGNNYKSAELYINSFRKYLFFRRKAGKYKKYINNEDIPDISVLVKEKRNIMPVKDFYVDRTLPYLDLISLLEDNKHNKMAFEYLMAYFLLNNDLASFVKYLNYSKYFDYLTIPGIYEEALTIYAFELQKIGKKLPNLRISKNTIDRFTGYVTTLEKYKGNREAARKELKSKYGDTYWYYIHYISPVTKGKKIIVK
jgi:hypothetical protein